ncbi:MAG: prepilin-type N-terminal cleavage/methylation domain-containing protein [Planctomycetota bacterium]
MCYIYVSQNNKNGKRPPGFSLIELLVVIGIIMMLSSISLIFISGFLKDERLKQGGLIVQSVFRKSQQLAATQRQMHFLVFETDKSLMVIYKDTNENQIYDAATDEQVDESIILPKEIKFLTGVQGPPLFRLTQPYLGFRSDGSLMMPTGVSDQSMVHPPKADKTDIVLEQKNKPKSKMYLDYTALTGKIRKMILYTEESIK